MQRKLRRFIQIDGKILVKNKKLKEIEKNAEDFAIALTEEDFQEKCHHNTMKENIHYLIDKQNHLFWQKSKGSISTLKKYLIMNKESEESINEEEIFHKNNEKFLIIAAEPGMGKSLILDRFTQNSSAENFFVKITLNTCTAILNDLKNQKVKIQNNDDSIEFVLKSVLGKTDEQEISLLKKLAKEEKLILMFDGLDEVYNYKEQVMQLIDAINKDANYRIKKFLITTRNHLKEELEDHFETFSFNLNNFDDDDQMSFLYKYWRSLYLKHKERPNSANLTNSSQNLIAKIKSTFSESINQLIGIPLQIKMLADIYFERMKNKEENIAASTIDIANIADLYHQFLETMVRENFKNRKIIDPNRNQRLFERENVSFYSDHIKLSASILFDGSSETGGDLKLTEEELLDYGVIVAFTPKSKLPTFLHQSFAEFFLAKSSFQKIKEQS
jgi:hypothetical protein